MNLFLALTIFASVGLTAVEDVERLVVYKLAREKADAAGIKHPPPIEPIFKERVLQETPQKPLPRKLAPFCPVTFDVVFLNDLSNSFTSSLPIIKTQMPELLTYFEDHYPGSRFALASFKDKPVHELGWEADYCFHNYLDFTTDSALVVSTFDTFTSGGGYDWPENQLEALLHAATSPDFSWRTGPSLPDQVFIKLIVLVTDSLYHIAGDAIPWIPGVLPNNGDGVLDCLGEDYPLITQLGEALAANAITPAFVVSESPMVPGIDLVEVYEELVHHMGSTNGVVVPLRADSADFAVAVENIVDEFDRICPEGLCQEEDAVVVRDMSHSTSNDIMRFVDYIEHEFGDGKPRNLGLTSFTDKPVPYYGYQVSMDFCYYNHLPGFQAYPAFHAEYTSSMVPTRSGGDFLENQLDALIRSVQEYKWTSPFDCRCVHLLTDAGYHQAGEFKTQDGIAEVYNYAKMITNEIKYCNLMDYPSLGQVYKTFAENRVHCLRVVTSPIAEPFWNEFKQKMAEIGQEISIEVVVLLKDLAALRKLYPKGSSVFPPQPSIKVTL